MLRVRWRQGGVTVPVRGLSILQISHGKHETPRLFSGPLVHILTGWEGVILNSFSSHSASIPVADRVIFPESETDPVILPLEALLFLPAGLKIRNYFLFFFMATEASCDLGFSGSLTPPHHCAVFSQPGVFLLSAVCGACLSQSPLHIVFAMPEAVIFFRLAMVSVLHSLV